MLQINCLGHNENVDYFCVADIYKNSILNFKRQQKTLIKYLKNYVIYSKSQKQHLYNKFEWTLDKLKCLKGNNINIALNNMVKFKEYQKKFMMNINQNTQILRQTLNQSIHELYLQEMGLFQFYLVKQCKIKENETCQTIALNSDSSLVICGFQSCIKIYEFNNQFFKEIQIIKKEKPFKLHFINNTDRFIQFTHNFILLGFHQTYNLFPPYQTNIDIFSKSNNQQLIQKQFQQDFISDLLFIMKDESFMLLTKLNLVIMNRLLMNIYQKSYDEQWEF